VGLRHLLSAPTSFGVPQRLGWDVAETDRGLWVMQEAEPHIWFAAVRPPACHPHNLACWKAAALAARHPAATNPLRGLALSGTDDCPPPHPPRPRPAPCSWRRATGCPVTARRPPCVRCSPSSTCWPPCSAAACRPCWTRCVRGGRAGGALPQPPAKPRAVGRAGKLPRLAHGGQ
jgi:hypothetical protein